MLRAGLRSARGPYATTERPAKGRHGKRKRRANGGRGPSVRALHREHWSERSEGRSPTSGADAPFGRKRPRIREIGANGTALCDRALTLAISSPDLLGAASFAAVASTRRRWQGCSRAIPSAELGPTTPRCRERHRPLISRSSLVWREVPLKAGAANRERERERVPTSATPWPARRGPRAKGRAARRWRRRARAPRHRPPTPRRRASAPRRPC